MNVFIVFNEKDAEIVGVYASKHAAQERIKAFLYPGRLQIIEESVQLTGSVPLSEDNRGSQIGQAFNFESVADVCSILWDVKPTIALTWLVSASNQHSDREQT